MTDDDRSRRDDEPQSEPDRAAILARRQRFIALALSSLASAAACEACTPKPCLNVVEPEPPDGKADGADANAEADTEPAASESDTDGEAVVR
jgi:hypothetical protein